MVFITSAGGVGDTAPPLFPGEERAGTHLSGHPYDGSYCPVVFESAFQHRGAMKPWELVLGRSARDAGPRVNSRFIFSFLRGLTADAQCTTGRTPPVLGRCASWRREGQGADVPAEAIPLDLGGYEADHTFLPNKLRASPGTARRLLYMSRH